MIKFNESEMRRDLENNQEDYTAQEIDFICDQIKERIAACEGTDEQIISKVLENFTTYMKACDLDEKDLLKKLHAKYDDVRLDDAHEAVYEYNEKQNAYLYCFSYYQAGINKHDRELLQLISLDNYLKDRR